MNIPRLLFRIFYQAFYWILLVCLFALLIITPADGIRQALDNSQLYNVFVIASCYAITAILAITILTSRLFTRRTVLSQIPKSFIPIEKGEVNKKVRKMIVASFTRSAAIAWDARPRGDSPSTTMTPEPNKSDPVIRLVEAEATKKKRILLHKRREETEKEEETITIPPEEPMWGMISHNGWASPTSKDLPNLQYINVIMELPHLIEARAVSVAPPDPESISNPPMPDIRAVDLLQRPAAMGLRDYIIHLISVEIITSPATATEFLASYEYARFSSQPLSEVQFRDLMKQFAELLRSMQALTPAILASLDIDLPESDIDNDNSSTTTASTHRSRSPLSPRTPSARSGSEGTIRTAHSRHIGTPGTSNTRRAEFSTAPATPRSRRRVISRTASANSFAQSRRPYNGSSGASSTSLGSSQGSVIRLSPTDGDGLPYTLTIPGAL